MSCRNQTHLQNKQRNVQNLETKPTTLLFDLETTPLSQEDVELHCLVTLDYETGETTRYNDIGGEQPIVRAVQYLDAVSYTHLTLPTSQLV